MFADDQRILMCSFYQHPLFPDMRQDPPAPNMVNITVDPYTSGDALRQLVSDTWLPRRREFQPEFVFISAGFDGHRVDDMGQLGLIESEYAWNTPPDVQREKIGRAEW